MWTEPTGTDMALSFQEAEGCSAIWYDGYTSRDIDEAGLSCVLTANFICREFVSQVQAQLVSVAGPGMSALSSPSDAARGAIRAVSIGHSTLTVFPPTRTDEALSDDALESNFAHLALPPPGLGNLPDIEQTMRLASATPPGRDSLTRFIISDQYILKLIPLVSTAEDLESLPDLHRLCNIMKTLILLNDNAIIEHVVTDDVILGVVGALECRPSIPWFPIVSPS